VLHRERRELIREADSLELLVCLDCAYLREDGGGVGGAGESVEEVARIGRRLTEEAVGHLRPLRKLESDRREAALAHDLDRGVERAGKGRARVELVVSCEVADVVRPGVSLRGLLLRLLADQGRLAFARED
jgi:hypothetical protein